VCRIRRWMGNAERGDRRVGRKNQRTGPFCVTSRNYVINQESALESVETSPAAGVRLPQLRSPRRGSNIWHPSQTGPLPAAA
jgi:hypothetical protein